MTVRRELLMPKLGLTMTEGLVADWMVAPGQAFGAGQGVFVVETDKVANEIPAEAAGTLAEILVPAGQSAPVGAVLAYWEDGQAAGAGATARAAAPAGAATSAPATPAPAAAAPAAAAVRIVASPLARRLARERGLDLAGVRGTGPRGRIVARDLPAASRAAAPEAAADDGYTRIAPTPLQATVARRLAQGKQETPHFYLAVEAEVSRLLALRRELNAQPGTRLTINHFIVQAVARALRALPWANRVWQDGAILAFDRIDVGVAVDTPAGLLAPAVRDIGGLGLGGLARRLDALVGRVREHGLRPEDLGQPAITVSNAGMHNVSYMTSIINPGQAMILGVGSIRELFRPDAQGQPALRREIGLVLSADHRILDGVRALEFVNEVVGLLEQPARLVLD
ncbi:2-oxo acid dehydrogenase subunit E2 [Bordetella hinzii]|nr:dihydrolipoamide acetyltransferase family protein [Bordetella hinzii]QII86539.1 2-oxo acid dehydrogenase subunit E2 [Bordetella hinzii]